MGTVLQRVYPSVWMWANNELNVLSLGEKKPSNWKQLDVLKLSQDGTRCVAKYLT